MTVQNYLFFEGRAEEAAEFYKKALGAEVLFSMRFKDMPGPHPPGSIPPGGDDKILHMSLRIGETTIMASDGRCAGTVKHEGFALSLSVSSEAEAGRVFAALSEGGQVQMPLGKTFFSPCFGMVSDKFGVSWMVIVPQEM